MDGYVNLWKPPGMTSFDAVRRVRRALGVKRLGHGGTLDPLAEGVLPLLVGKATRLAEYLSTSAKAYRATVRLGVRTDTLDRDGRVLAEEDPGGVRRGDVESLLSRFTGNIQQNPPMYSALKHGGERLYRLARRGVTVERAARETFVHSIQLVGWDLPQFELEVVCASGTYVRTLAADIGDELGCGAALDGLVRVRVGVFEGDQAVSLDQAAGPKGKGCVLGLTNLFPGWRALHLNELGLSRALTGSVLGDDVGNWGAIPGAVDPPFVPEPPNDLAVALGAGGEFVAVLMRTGGTGDAWRPRKVLAPPLSGARQRPLAESLKDSV